MILKNQSLKVNLVLLLVGLLLLFYLTLKLSLFPSWRAYAQHSKMQTELDNQDEIDRDLALWKQKLADSGAEYLDQNFSEQTFEASLLNFMGQQRSRKELSISAMSEAYQRRGEGYKIETVEIETMGSYKSQLRLLHAIETEYKSAAVVSASMNKRRNLKKKREELIQKIYVQRITKLD